MPRTIKLKNAEEARNAIMKEQQVLIRRIYKQAAAEMAHEAKRLSNVGNVSSILREIYLIDLQKKANKEIAKISTQLERNVIQGMTSVSQAMVDNTLRNLETLGMNTVGMLSNVPSNVVRNIATGNVYENHWNLSKRIWGIQEKTMQDIHTVISKGVVENKSVYDIAKELEKYVDPSAAKNWDWSKVYPGTSRVVDYNAQRLARTLTQHAFQQACQECNDCNPWVTGYEWRSALIHGRTCEECMDRDGTIYDKDKVPMDHPQGLCTILPVVNKPLSSIAQDIAKWNKSQEGTYPDIDKFAAYMKTK